MPFVLMHGDYKKKKHFKKGTSSPLPDIFSHYTATNKIFGWLFCTSFWYIALYYIFRFLGYLQFLFYFIDVFMKYQNKKGKSDITILLGVPFGIIWHFNLRFTSTLGFRRPWKLAVFRTKRKAWPSRRILLKYCVRSQIDIDPRLTGGGGCYLLPPLVFRDISRSYKRIIARFSAKLSIWHILTKEKLVDSDTLVINYVRVMSCFPIFRQKKGLRETLSRKQL